MSSPATATATATPGRIACDIVSPIRLIRRSIRNTPTGPAPSASANIATSAWRGCVIGKRRNEKIEHACVRPRRRGRRRHPRRTPRTSGAPSGDFPRSARRCVAPQATGSRASSNASGNVARTRSRSCSAAITVRFSPCQRCTSATRSLTVLASTALNGSSSTITRASCNSSRANNARCICPVESVPIGRSSKPVRPTAAMACSIFARSARPMPPNRPVDAPQAHRDEIVETDRKAAVDIGGLRQIGDVLAA